MLIALFVSTISPFSVHATDPEGQKNRQYDVTKPVIQKIEFPQQGKTVRRGEIVRLYIYAYDADTAEGELKIEGRVIDSRIGWMKSSYDAEKKRYVCEYTITTVNTEKTIINSVRVTDKAGNYLELSCCDEKGEYQYWVFVEQQKMEEIHISRDQSQDQSQNQNQNQNKSPMTGDKAMGMVWVWCAISSLGMAIYLRKRKVS